MKWKTLSGTQWLENFILCNRYLKIAYYFLSLAFVVLLFYETCNAERNVQCTREPDSPRVSFTRS